MGIIMKKMAVIVFVALFPLTAGGCAGGWLSDEQVDRQVADRPSPDDGDFRYEQMDEPQSGFNQQPAQA